MVARCLELGKANKAWRPRQDVVGGFPMDVVLLLMLFFGENPLGTEHPWKIIVLHYYHDLQMVKPRSHDGIMMG